MTAKQAWILVWTSNAIMLVGSMVMFASLSVGWTIWGAALGSWIIWMVVANRKSTQEREADQERWAKEWT